MRIAFVVIKNLFRGGGIEKYTLELGSRLAKRGHDVTVFCMKHYGEVASSYEGMHIVPVWSFRNFWMQKLSASAVAGWKVLRDGSYDIVHFHSTAAGAFGFLARLRGQTCVLQMHGLEWRRSRWGWMGKQTTKLLERIAMPQAHVHTAVSQSQCAYLGDVYGCGILYVPTAAQIKEIVPPRDLFKLGVEPGRYLLFASRLVREKGAHTLIRAFRGLDTELKLVIAGDAPGPQNYRRELLDLAAGDQRILFPGFVQGRLLEELFGHAYVYLQPSVVEGLSISLLEAMSYGRCCLVSDIPENIEAIEGCGYTFESENVKDLQNKLRLLIDDSEAVRATAEKCIERVRQHYSWDVVTQQMEQLYLHSLRRRLAA